MARPKGSKNKKSTQPYTNDMSTSERIELLANIIIDTIIEDQINGSPLLKNIKAEQAPSNSR
jgi:hypothetical protein